VVLRNVFAVLVRQVCERDIGNPIWHEELPDYIWDSCEGIGSYQAWYNIWEFLQYEVLSSIDYWNAMASN
jgi:hypothetical protein